MDKRICGELVYESLMPYGIGICTQEHGVEHTHDGVLGVRRIQDGDVIRYDEDTDIGRIEPIFHEMLQLLKNLRQDLENNGEIFETDQRRIDAMTDCIDKARRQE